MSLFKMRIGLPFKVEKPILAVGADLKNSLCFAYNKSAFVSDVIHDLEVLENFKRFKTGISSVSKRFGLSARIIVYDKHPGYFSTRYALSLHRNRGIKSIAILHHHAHIASCMLENNLSNQRVIGIAFDGAGYGSDQTLWGSEFLIADYKKFKRAAHLRYIPLLGSQKAIYEPWRVACAWLYLAFGKDFLDLGVDFTKQINKRYWVILEKMWRQNFNAPVSSSIGRLFDAVAALVLGIRKVKFEAEAAINLEQSASSYKSYPSCYRFKLKERKQLILIDPILTFKDIVVDLKNNCNKNEIAARFHMTLARIIRDTSVMIRDNTRINTVALTGGVFQNKILFKLSLDLLEKAGFHTLTHKILPCSDACISLGQVAIAHHIN